MPTEIKTHALDQSILYKLQARAKLAKLLGLTGAELRHLSKWSNTLYSEWDEPKKDGAGFRHIENPARLLKQAQGRLAKVLGRITPPSFLFCPVKKRCYVSNAAQHRGNRVVKSLDIQKYFPNTKAQRVFWFFNSVMKCDRAIAGTLTSLACYKNHLPTGSPLSPIMAFYAHIDMWDKIGAICTREGITLTVYIDDVTVSGMKVPESVMWEIRRAIHGTGHRYHKEKVFVDRPAEVTGVFVAGTELIAPHKQFKKVRNTQAIVRSGKGTTAKAAMIKLAGLQAQLAQIRTKSRTLPISAA